MNCTYCGNKKNSCLESLPGVVEAYCSGTNGLSGYSDKIVFDDGSVLTGSFIKNTVKPCEEYLNTEHEELREHYVWKRHFDKDGVPLVQKQFITLRDISDSHLVALVDWTDGDPNIKAEVEYRKLHNIHVGDYDD